MDWDYNMKLNYERESSRYILCIDCKSFYTSVEFVERALNPLTNKLVVMSYIPQMIQNSGGIGLISASFPTTKKVFGIKNISHARDFPSHIRRIG